MFYAEVPTSAAPPTPRPLGSALITDEKARLIERGAFSPEGTSPNLAVDLYKKCIGGNPQVDNYKHLRYLVTSVAQLQPVEVKVAWTAEVHGTTTATLSGISQADWAKLTFEEREAHIATAVSDEVEETLDGDGRYTRELDIHTANVRHLCSDRAWRSED